MLKLLRKIDDALFGRHKIELAVLLSENLRGCDSLLDVGCGSASPIKDLTVSIRRKAGVDIFEPSIEKSRAAGIHDEYHRINVLEILGHFGQKSFDAVIANDLIEHLTKEDGLELMRQMEAVARKKVMIFTPNGFLTQGEFDNNPFQVHHSGWDPQEMREFGYEVIGAGGLKPLRGEYSTPTIKPRQLGGRISYLTQNMVRNNPEKAFAILCIKEMQANSGSN